MVAEDEKARVWMLGEREQKNGDRHLEGEAAGEEAATSRVVMEKRPRGRPRKTAGGEKYQRKPQVWRSEVYRVTDSDLDVLQWVAEQRWSTKEVLVRSVYAKPDPKRLNGAAKPSGAYGLQRIQKLIRSGYLEASRFRVGQTVPLLLTPTGYALLHGQGRVEWAHHFPDLNPAMFEHELLLQELRIQLEQLGATVWQGERELAWVNRVEGLPFVSDARFRAGGWVWHLEVERTLKSKDRRIKSAEVRAKLNDRYLYVVPERIWEAVKESITQGGLIGFEGGLYWLSDSNARSGQMTVRCKWSDWKQAPLQTLLGGGFEPELTQRRKATATWQAEQAMKREFSNLAFSVHNHITTARGALQRYVEQLANKRKDKLEVPKFSSTDELASSFRLMTAMRRKWRETHSIELDGFKALEMAFYAYDDQLSATQKAIAKSIADGNPQAFRLSRGDDLEKALFVLSAR